MSIPGPATINTALRRLMIAPAPSTQLTDNEDLLDFDDLPEHQEVIPWDDDIVGTEFDPEDFPNLDGSVFRDGDSKGPDFLTGVVENASHSSEEINAKKRTLPNAQVNAPSYDTAQTLATHIQEENEIDVREHKWHPDNYSFRTKDFWNPYTEQWNCPWPNCR
jgi:hypothetical protein